MLTIKSDDDTNFKSVALLRFVKWGQNRIWFVKSFPSLVWSQEISAGKICKKWTECPKTVPSNFVRISHALQLFYGISKSHVLNRSTIAKPLLRDKLTLCMQLRPHICLKIVQPICGPNWTRTINCAVFTCIGIYQTFISKQD